MGSSALRRWGVILFLAGLPTFFLEGCDCMVSDKVGNRANVAEAIVDGDALPRACDLSVLTWNVWLMPPITFQSPRNGPRAKAIAAEILTRNDDIVCLEKVFDSGARANLCNALATEYPYQYGPINPGFLLVPFKPINGGVMVFSKMPLLMGPHPEIDFRDSAGWESFSRKGAILLSGFVSGHRFQILAAHLQGEDSEFATSAHQLIRERQFAQIRHELLDPNSKPDIAVIMCGDMNTPRRDERDSARFSAAYQSMLSILGAEESLGDRVTLDDDRRRNDLADGNSGLTTELDYVLSRGNGMRTHIERRRIIFRRTGWDWPRNRSDLSYRYAVESSIFFN